MLLRSISGIVSFSKNLVVVLFILVPCMLLVNCLYVDRSSKYDIKARVVTALILYHFPLPFHVIDVLCC